jgi:hypothetical protein
MGSVTIKIRQKNTDKIFLVKCIILSTSNVSYELAAYTSWLPTFAKSLLKLLLSLMP